MHINEPEFCCCHSAARNIVIAVSGKDESIHSSDDLLRLMDEAAATRKYINHGAPYEHAAIKCPVNSRDDGKPVRRVQPRNAPCCCGSGRKAKKCCVYFPEESQ